jgi:hypothetical protein
MQRQHHHWMAGWVQQMLRPVLALPTSHEALEFGAGLIDGDPGLKSSDD